MDAHAWIAVGTLVATIVLFVTRWLPREAVALGIPVVLAATGTLSDPGDALVGFGNHAVIAIGAIFILGAGLKESGVATFMARGLDRLSGQSEAWILLVIMVPVCALSGFMSSTATVAVFLPAVAALARRRRIPDSRLLMPLGFAAVLGGTLTLIGAMPNLILGNELMARDRPGLGMFEFAVAGAPAAALGILYIVTVGRRLLPERSSGDRIARAPLPADVARSYGFERNLHRARVGSRSGLAGRSIGGAAIGREYDIDIVQVHRPGNLRSRYLHPRPDLRLEPGDELWIEGEEEDVSRFAVEQGLTLEAAGPHALERLMGHGVALAEVTLSPHSEVFGKTLTEIRFRNTFGLTVISIWRHGEAVTAGIAEMPLDLGDALLVSGPTARMRLLERDPDYIVLTDRSRDEDLRRAPLAALILLAAILPPALGWLPLAVSAMGAALLMVGTGCLSLPTARRAVDFRVLFLLIGTIPLGLALEQTGVATIIARAILAVESGLGEPGLLLCLFGLASVLSMTCNNGAAAVILAPVAFHVAAEAGMDVTKAFLAVAFGTSCVFMSPFGSQCNLMVTGPGGYTARDFLRVGAGLTVVMAATVIVILSLL